MNFIEETNEMFERLAMQITDEIMHIIGWEKRMTVKERQSFNDKMDGFVKRKIKALYIARFKKLVGMLRIPEYHKLSKESQNKLKVMTSYGAYVGIKKANDNKLDSILGSAKQNQHQERRKGK